MTAATSLGEMLRELAAMQPASREAVLGALGQAERETLRLRLVETESSRLSPALTELVDLCRSSALPGGLTERAAEALRNAAETAAQRDGIDEALTRLRANGPLRRRSIRRREGRP